MFGSHQMCTLFSTRSPYLAGKHSNLHSITAQDGPSTVTLRMGGQGKRQYMCFDEAFFKNLEKIQWNRDNGYVELVPILVVIPDV